MITTSRYVSLTTRFFARLGVFWEVEVSAAMPLSDRFPSAHVYTTFPSPVQYRQRFALSEHGRGAVTAGRSFAGRDEVFDRGR